MKESFVDDVYYSLIGELVESAAVAGVITISKRGMPYLENYHNAMCAYSRLCSRLGVCDEDRDVEIILHSLLENERIVAREMFQYGRMLQE